MSHFPRAGERLAGVRSVLDVVATLLVIGFAAALTWRLISPRLPARAQAVASPSRTQPEPKLPTSPLKLEGAPIRGSIDAKVGMIIFSDFQCPYCAAFARETLPALIKQYVETNKVLLAFRHFPLETIHPLALAAATAATCAANQGMFWKIHDDLFGVQDGLREGALESIVGRLKTDGTGFDRCRSEEGMRKVRADQQQARTLGVSGTPTFFIGRVSPEGLRVAERMSGSQPIGEFQAAIERALGSSGPTGK